MFPVSRLCPGESRPTMLISGHWSCSGWGSEAMLWLRVSLLTNKTRVPGAIVSDVGLAPFAVIVIVRLAAEGSEGVEGELDPPQDAKRIAALSNPLVRRTKPL
jgi:hypothetical protein